MSANRRRQHSEDNDGYGKKRKGAPLINEAVKKLQEIIGKIGDKNSTQSSIESNLEDLCRVLQEDLDKFRTSIIEAIVGCAIYLPSKCTVYTTLVGLLNSKNFNFGGDVVEKLVFEQNDLLNKGMFNEAQNLTTFLCDLGNCRVLTIQSIAEYLESLITAAFEENVPQVRTDWFIFTLLRSLPWIGAELAEKAAEQLENIIKGVEGYLNKRKKDHVTILQVWSPHASPHEQEDYLDSLFAQILVLRDAEWKEKHIPRHYVGFDMVLQDALQHNLPSFSPPTHSDSITYPFPRVVFRIFDYADCPEDGTVLPGTHSIERFLIEMEIDWIIEKNCKNRKSCANELLQFAQENVAVPMGYLIFETIFAQMFRLPESPHPQIFYGSLLLELCKLQASTYPQILVQSVELLYQRADFMQPICIDRLVDWFSFHLSNFQYRYSWSDWNDCIDKDSYSGSFAFAREVIEKCRRLGSYDKIVQSLPKEFVRIHPTNPDIRYMLDDEMEPGYEKAIQFTKMFQERQPSEAFIDMLRLPDDQGYNVDDFGVFLSVMLKMAAKTYSHNFSALSKYQVALKTICDYSEVFQEKLLATIYNCWKTNQQMMMILIDKLLKMQVLDCSQVISWLFDPNMRLEHDRQWTFEILNSALEKLSHHIVSVEKDYNELKEKVEKKVKKEDGDENENKDDQDEKMEQGDNEDDAERDELNAQKEKLESLVDFQKNLYMDVLHKFSLLLVDVKSQDAESPMYNWIKGRYSQVFLRHCDTLKNFTTSLSEELFIDDVDESVLSIYQQFLALRQ